MNFKDFTPEELIGKYVLIDGKYSKSINRITRVTKKYFGVSNSNSLYELTTGRSRGDDIWNTIYAKLISDEDANKISLKWKEDKAKKQMVEDIMLRVQGKNISYSTLTEIINILNS